MAARKQAKPAEANVTVLRVIEYRDPTSLTPYGKNARTHSDAQVRQIRASIDRFGPTNPILIDEEGRIIAGHGRQMAAALSPAIESFPCIILTGLSAKERKALVLADNRIAMNAGWDINLLREEISSLRQDGVDLIDIGFDAKELDKLFKDAAPENLGPQLGGLTYQVVVSCADEMAQTEMLDRFEREGLKCRPLIS